MNKYQAKKLTDKNRHKTPATWYGKAWQTLQTFPQFLAQGNQNPPNFPGEAAAAFLSAAIACLSMMVAHHLSNIIQTPEIEKQLLFLGSWLPGTNNPDPSWGNLGSYSGKETVLLLAWLVSWVVLSWRLKHSFIKPRTLFFWMIILMTLATVMAWHPLFPYLPLA